MADQALPAVLEEIFATESKPDAVAYVKAAGI
jgi:hypothetical protein